MLGSASTEIGSWVCAFCVTVNMYNVLKTKSSQSEEQSLSRQNDNANKLLRQIEGSIEHGEHARAKRFTLEDSGARARALRARDPANETLDRLVTVTRRPCDDDFRSSVRLVLRLGHRALVCRETSSFSSSTFPPSHGALSPSIPSRPGDGHPKARRGPVDLYVC